MSRTKNKTIMSLTLFIIAAVLLCSLSINAGNARAGSGTDEPEIIKLGNWTEADLDKVMKDSSESGSTGKQIDFISEKFLDTPYKDSTLTGDLNTQEVFTIDLEGMDCFTYIDYVEAMRLSESFPQFEEELKKVRYKKGNINFQDRNHFFSDWTVYNKNYVRDLTREIGGEKTRELLKNLNRKKDGTVFLPGIPVTERTIYYIPSAEIDKTVTDKLNTGDYVGIYTDIEGLDVSHTGIIIKKEGGIFLRHASSRENNKKVVDEDLIEYIQNKPGLVIYRPVN
ncbi:MAG: DUF1460 domain-containing protein [Deltaproteobacteria bacterium]